MKLSAAAVLLSLSSASAFSVSYLNQLSTGASSAPTGAGITSYLDGMSGASTEQVPALVTALETAPVPAAPATPAPAAGDYLSALGGASTPVSGGGITSYLDALPKAMTQTSGAGITGYLDALPATGAAPVTGSGVTSYLDTVGGGSSAPIKVAPPAPAAAAPAPVAAAPAPVAAVAPVASTAPAAGDYLSTLNSGAAAPISGAGIQGYLSSLPATGATPTSGTGPVGYLDALPASSVAPTSGAGMTGYLDALATNSDIAGPAGGSSLTSFLENVYSQIMSLPDDGSRKVANGSVTFAKAEGSYAMSFVKK